LATDLLRLKFITATPMQVERIAAFKGKFRKNKSFCIGFLILSLFLICAAFAPIFSPYDPNAQKLGDRLQPGIWAGNRNHLLGTDQLGRDILSRIIFGTRVSFLVGLFSVGIMVFFGTLFGLVSGYYGGAIDLFFMRIVDIFLSFPETLLAIGIMAALGPGIVNALIAIGLVFTPKMTRLIRGSTLAKKEADYIEAARSIGAPTWRIFIKHLIPNISAEIIVFSAITMGQTIIYIAALGFLGLGAQPPTAEWGAMISVGADYLVVGKWWPSTFPGIAIALAVIGFVLMGDALRDILDHLSFFFPRGLNGTSWRGKKPYGGFMRRSLSARSESINRVRCLNRRGGRW
jgi:ABC-type dipeptide/oligopeptide/nickel transport system permease subunit